MPMTSEEKKAIEQLKEAQKRMTTPMFLKDVKYNNDDYSKAIDTILNLIDNQQKEIEILTAMKPLQELIDTNVIIADYAYNYISKDKIREIIGKYIDIQEHKKYTNQELYGEDLKNMINELLEENSR